MKILRHACHRFHGYKILYLTVVAIVFDIDMNECDECHDLLGVHNIIQGDNDRISPFFRMQMY